MSQPQQVPAPPSASDGLAGLAARARLLAVTTVSHSKAGHVGGPLSAMDLLVSLFFERMRIRPDDPQWPERDKFVLSKGHSAIALYAVMALRGYFPVEELATFDKGDSRLQGHPDPTKLPGIEVSSGSLGQGLSVGVGFALGNRLKSSDAHTWIMLGDGELQEGMVWEAAHVAARYRLGHLTAIVDDNGLQQFGWLNQGQAPARADRRGPWDGFSLSAMWEAFGWHVIECDGHEFSAIRAAYDEAQQRASHAAPTVIIARTVKGKGLSFAEGRYTWHTGIATPEELSQAEAELGSTTEGAQR